MVVVVRRGKLIISVLPEVGGRDHRAHCHVRWTDRSCAVALDDFELLAGEQPPQSTWDELNGKNIER